MKKIKNIALGCGLLLCTFLFIQCKNNKETHKDKVDREYRDTTESRGIKMEEYGTMPDGTPVEQYILSNKNGMEVKVITYGGRITSLKVPDKNGKSENVVLGFDSLDDYLADNPFFGALIGRFGNRIANGKFSLDGHEYMLAQNDGKNHLHGGEKGFDKVVWKAIEEGENSLKLTYVSKDMEEGYPGDLETTVRYTLTKDNQLKVEYEATTDKKTILNLTQHSYFNLSGDLSSSITDHELSINATEFLPVNASLIPTGEMRKVEGTPFDFRKSKTIGQDIEQQDSQLSYGGGYDHCWILDKEEDDRLVHAASLYHEKSGRLLEVETTEPGLQFYAGNMIDEGLPIPGTNGKKTYPKRSGLCLETQHYPDTPNQKDFPTVILEPGDIFSSETIFKFSVK